MRGSPPLAVSGVAAPVPPPVDATRQRKIISVLREVTTVHCGSAAKGCQRYLSVQESVDSLFCVLPHRMTRLKFGTFLLSAALLVFVPLARIGFAVRHLTSGYEWYYEFARTVFEPQRGYWAESLLVPLLANVMGAAGSLAAYKIFCLALTVVCLVWLAALIADRLQSPLPVMTASIGIALFPQIVELFGGVLGSPDPLVAVALCTAVLAPSPAARIAALFVASMTHFTLTAMATPAIVILNAHEMRLTIRDAIRDRRLWCLALTPAVAGFALLAWFLAFSYRFMPRAGWVAERGLGYFIDFNMAQIDAFYTVIGPVAIAATVAFAAIATLRRDWLALLGILTALICAYVAHFLSVDRPRIFGTIYMPAYLYALVYLGKRAHETIATLQLAPHAHGHWIVARTARLASTVDAARTSAFLVTRIASIRPLIRRQRSP